MRLVARIPATWPTSCEGIAQRLATISEIVPSAAAPAPTTQSLLANMNTTPTITAKRLTAMNDSYWLWMAHRSERTARMAKLPAWPSRPSISSVTPLMSSHLRPVPSARMSRSVEIP